MRTHSQAASAAWRIIMKTAWIPGLGLASCCMALCLQFSFLTALLPVAGWLLFVFSTLYFFRDPNPRVPSDSSTFLAPAHGRVDCVDQIVEPLFMGGACRRISIFLSVFDVHVQNAPAAGRIAYVRHQSGRFLNALRTESATANENVLIGIESSEPGTARIAVRQIAGLIARRIVTWVELNDRVERGERLGLIQFGSRCDLYLPLSTEIVIQPGSRVVAGQTVVAKRPRPPGTTCA